MRRKSVTTIHGMPAFEPRSSILEFQQLVHEETQSDGLLYPVRWLLNSLIQSIFLLGISVLCYYFQLVRSATDVPLESREDS